MSSSPSSNASRPTQASNGPSKLKIQSLCAAMRCRTSALANGDSPIAIRPATRKAASNAASPVGISRRPWKTRCRARGSTAYGTSVVISSTTREVLCTFAVYSSDIASIGVRTFATVIARPSIVPLNTSVKNMFGIGAWMFVVSRGGKPWSTRDASLMRSRNPLSKPVSSIGWRPRVAAACASSS